MCIHFSCTPGRLCTQTNRVQTLALPFFNYSAKQIPTTRPWFLPVPLLGICFPPMRILCLLHGLGKAFCSQAHTPWHPWALFLGLCFSLELISKVYLLIFFLAVSSLLSPKFPENKGFICIVYCCCPPSLSHSGHSMNVWWLNELAPIPGCFLEP